MSKLTGSSLSTKVDVKGCGLADVKGCGLEHGWHGGIVERCFEVILNSLPPFARDIH